MTLNDMLEEVRKRGLCWAATGGAVSKLPGSRLPDDMVEVNLYDPKLLGATTDAEARDAGSRSWIAYGHTFEEALEGACRTLDTYPKGMPPDKHAEVTKPYQKEPEPFPPPGKHFHATPIHRAGTTTEVVIEYLREKADGSETSVVTELGEIQGVLKTAFAMAPCERAPDYAGSVSSLLGIWFQAGAWASKFHPEMVRMEWKTKDECVRDSEKSKAAKKPKTEDSHYA